uniref:Uncharacterized protein n=1 Tax=Eiseniibacteriota bacterium TaxID=2212470 RepID=A0A832I475_UNCEI
MAGRLLSIACAAVACAAALACAPPAARAGAPAPVSPALHAFPGGFPSPGSAASAALALAPRYLGEEPYDNPAVAPRRAASLTPMLLRVSRQDLRREHREVDEQPVFFDAGGVWAVLGAGPVAFALYGYQPLLRLEDNAFVRGRGTDPTVPPATVAGNASARELRAGFAASWGGARARVGAAVEWTQRQDRYEVTETSGSPASGTTSAEFSGGGAGAQAGAWARVRGDGGAGTVDAGLAARWVPSLTLDVTLAEDLLSGSSSGESETTREGSLEGGLSLRWAATEAFHVLASASGRGEERWEGWGLARGAGSGWRVAGEYHDRRDPWTVRFGYGVDEERGVPEPRASLLGLGLGWQLETTRLDLAIAHRSVRRPGEPNSSDDRVVISVVQAF